MTDETLSSAAEFWGAHLNADLDALNAAVNAEFHRRLGAIIKSGSTHSPKGPWVDAAQFHPAEWVLPVSGGNLTEGNRDDATLYDWKPTDEKG